MVAWSVFSVGGVYMWAGVPLMVAGAALLSFGRPWHGFSSETRSLDVVLLTLVAVAAAQLVPLPPAVRTLVSPPASDSTTSS